jgi:hypothetical protein
VAAVGVSASAPIDNYDKSAERKSAAVHENSESLFCPFLDCLGQALGVVDRNGTAFVKAVLFPAPSTTTVLGNTQFVKLGPFDPCLSNQTHSALSPVLRWISLPGFDAKYCKAAKVNVMCSTT